MRKTLTRQKLAVVVITIAKKRSSLALANVVGSSIGNILGAFSLGLLFHKGDPRFDKSSRLYSLALLLITTAVSVPLLFDHIPNGHILGIVLVVTFAIYVTSIAWTISRGIMAAPVGSDSDSDSESEEDSTSSDDEPGERTALVKRPAGQLRRPRPLLYHVGMLLLGFGAVLLSSFVLSNAAVAIVDAFGVSDILFGMVFLSIATTLPEKFIAAVSGAKGQIGITVANTVGSNIFLLTLCLGVALISTHGNFDAGSVSKGEIAWLWGSAAFMTANVWLAGGRTKLAGLLMLLAYAGFLAFEIVTRGNVAD